MKKSVVATVVVLALVGLGVASVPLAEAYIAGRIKAEIERNGSATVDAVEIGLFERHVTLVNFRSRRGDELTARRLEASGLSGSFGDFVQGHTPLSDFRLGDPMRADRIRLVDARLVDRSDNESWSVASLTIDGFDLARYDSEVDGPFRLPVLSARIAAALLLRHVEISNLIYTMPVTGNTAGIGDVKIDRFERGKIGAVEMVHLEITPKAADQASLKVDQIEAKDVDFGRTLARLSSASWIPGAPLGRVDIAAASAEGFGGSLLSNYGVALGAIAMDTTRDSIASSRSHLRVDGLVLRSGATPEGARLRMLLQAMGLKELSLGFDCAGSERRNRGELTIDRCLLTAADLGDLSLVAGFVDIDESFWQAIDTGDFRLASRSSIALGSARLSFADKGLLDRSMRALAAATGQLPVEARAKLAHDIRTYQPPNVLITDDLTKLLETVAQFVERGGTLAFDLKPDPPLGFAAAIRLRNPSPDLVNMLGLSATLSR